MFQLFHLVFTCVFQVSCFSYFTSFLLVFSRCHVSVISPRFYLCFPGVMFQLFHLVFTCVFQVSCFSYFTSFLLVFSRCHVSVISPRFYLCFPGVMFQLFHLVFTCVFQVSCSTGMTLPSRICTSWTLSGCATSWRRSSPSERSTTLPSEVRQLLKSVHSCAD